MTTATTSTEIVVGVDGSDQSIDALRHAKQLADALGHTIRVVIAWEWPITYTEFADLAWDPEQDALTIAGDVVNAVYGTRDAVPVAAVKGPAAKVLIEASENAFMLVVGSRGHGGFAGLLLGSVSSACAEHAQCAVLVVHTPRES